MVERGNHALKQVTEAKGGIDRCVEQEPFVLDMETVDKIEIYVTTKNKLWSLLIGLMLFLS